MKKQLALLSAAVMSVLSGCNKVTFTENTAAVTTEAVTVPTTEEAITTAAPTDVTESITEYTAYDASLLSSPDDIGLHDTDGNGVDYIFSYGGEEFYALYEPDNWHITDSYKIEDEDDILLICQALISVHPIHSADMQSYRAAEGMAFEWHQHNLAYNHLPDSSEWKSNAKDVDLDSKDEGKGLFNFLMDRLDSNEQTE
ncbi:acid shock protein [Ruminococcus flavefaciens]|uniref:Uncharacterized protein n=1 Tax=Ruminococcus flavefaciens TaxID=1265 RepID=A0A315XUT7_RUMFL|nr:acid shock protein [Ruminococcus flavefaciens]PWJ10807.1 hypothetical protein IE37_02845 [Ruminococcus flavefaciens]SSA51383.1 hypothetical protein SAMN02910325_02845 [Ruminococcus flavefaciens]